MTSEAPTKAYVWTWLPGATEPVPAGVLEAHDDPRPAIVTFAYARSYLARGGPALYLPELPLRSGRQTPPAGLEVAGVIRDGGPDAWGQRVVMRRLVERDVRGDDPGEVSLLTYLLESGSDRAGSLDFQASPTTYVSRSGHGTLEELQETSDRIASGDPLPGRLADVLDAGSSVGGARPKATLLDEDRHLIAKFSTANDPYPVVKAEALAMHLAEMAGLDVAPCELTHLAGRDVLLVERFDREAGGRRRGFVSALTILELHEMVARYATYHDLADQIRARFTRRRATLRELFARIAFSMLVGNTDDHARNHAAFWDGDRLTLTPAYDLCPQLRSGGEAAQAMAYGPAGQRLAQLSRLVAACETYELDSGEARDIIDHQLDTIVTRWSDAADRSRLTEVESAQLWGRQICNPFTTDGYLPAPLEAPRHRR